LTDLKILIKLYAEIITSKNITYNLQREEGNMKKFLIVSLILAFFSFIGPGSSLAGEEDEINEAKEQRKQELKEKRERRKQELEELKEQKKEVFDEFKEEKEEAAEEIYDDIEAEEEDAEEEE
jgi:hypothetical protein